MSGGPEYALRLREVEAECRRLDAANVEMVLRAQAAEADRDRWMANFDALLAAQGVTGERIESLEAEVASLLKRRLDSGTICPKCDAEWLPGGVNGVIGPCPFCEAARLRAEVERLTKDLADTHHNMTLYADERNEYRAEVEEARAETVAALGLIAHLDSCRACAEDSEPCEAGARLLAALRSGPRAGGAT
jgi:hypothetical protein